MSSLTLPTAKVFITGRSQAVRLPKAFRFETDEVTIERQGDAIILRPLDRSHEAWVASLMAACKGLEGMDFIERDRKPLTDDIDSLD